MADANRIGEVLVETYRIERLLAEGGMGSVYEARHVRLPKRFAVKFLNVSLLGNAEALARFRREAEIIATLEHPNVVNLLDYNVTVEGVPFIVLEFLDGDHLGKRIARGRIPLSEAMRIVAPVVHALSAAHERTIVHRDLKPENIVLCRGDVVKVVDFGIAKIRGGAELTANNMILGTVPYMAPEQLFGSAVDARTDQFALAAILYEMLSGEMAFGATGSVPEVAARVASYEPPDVPSVNGAVNQVLRRAMAKKAADRFPSVQAFLQALVEAASQPDEPPPVAEDLGGEGLPPLSGEATLITTAPRPAAVAPVAPAPDERASFGADDSPTVHAFSNGESAPSTVAAAGAAAGVSDAEAGTAPCAPAPVGDAAGGEPGEQGLPPLAELSTVQISREQVAPTTRGVDTSIDTARLARSGANGASAPASPVLPGSAPTVRTEVVAAPPGPSEVTAPLARAASVELSSEVTVPVERATVDATAEVATPPPRPGADDVTGDVEVPPMAGSARWLWIALGFLITTALTAGVWAAFLRR